MTSVSALRLAGALLGLPASPSPVRGGAGAEDAILSAPTQRAKAAFTIKPALPPWTNAPSKRLESILATTSFAGAPEPGLPADLRTAFGAWRMLDQLQVLADAVTSAGPARRQALNARFNAGLREVQTFLASSTANKADIHFSQPARVLRTTALETIPTPRAATERRDAPVRISEPLAMRVTVETGSGSRRVDVTVPAGDMTLNTIAEHLNAALAAAPKLDADGNTLVDDTGSPLPAFGSRFMVTPAGSGWRLGIEPRAGERLRLDEIGSSPTSLIVAQLDRGASPTMARVRDMEGRTVIDSSALPAAGQPGYFAAAGTQVLAAVSGGTDGRAFVLSALGDDNKLGSKLQTFVSALASDGSLLWRRSVNGGIAEAAPVMHAGRSSVASAASIVSPGGTAVAVEVFDHDGRRMAGAQIDGADHPLAVRAGEGGAVTLLAMRDGAPVVWHGGKPPTETQLPAGFRARALVGPSGERVLGTMDGKTVIMPVPASGAAGQPSVLASGPLLAHALSDNETLLATVTRSAAGAHVITVADPVDGRIIATRELAGVYTVDGVSIAGDRLTVAGRQADGQVSVETLSADLSSSAQTVWGRREASGPLRLAAWPGGGGQLATLGLRAGWQEAPPQRMEDSTAARAGDVLTIVAKGRRQDIVFRDGDTPLSLAQRITAALGGTGRSLVQTVDGEKKLRIEATGEATIAVLGGPQGRDLAAKLGIEPARLAAPRVRGSKEPLVSPGGVFGLGLSMDLNIASTPQARAARDALADAKGKLQSAYRSLYWDDTKQAIVEGAARPAISGADAARIARYKDALARLGGP